MEDLAKLHDEALERELYIVTGAEKLGEIRLKMCRKKDANILNDALSVLDDIENDVEGYRDWIKEQFKILRR